MFKLKFYLWNAFLASLIGMAVAVFVFLRYGWLHSFHQLFSMLSKDTITILQFLLFCMAVGAVIGTISLFFVFQVFSRLSQRPLIGLICNFSVVAALNIIGAIAMGVRNYQQFSQSIWFWSLPVSEVLGFFLVSTLYKRMLFYKIKLEQKKVSLHNQRDS